MAHCTVHVVLLILDVLLLRHVEPNTQGHAGYLIPECYLIILQIIPLHLPPGDTSTERSVYINGLKEQIESAKELINEVISGVSHHSSRTCIAFALSSGRMISFSNS